MTETVTIGTLAPKSSPWGKVFETWTKAVSERSGSTLELQFFYNGQQGDEETMLERCRAGELDGAAVTSVGLSKVYKPILALQMPIFTSWEQLDRARAALRRELERALKERGLSLIGWGDVGLVRLFSPRAAPPATPAPGGDDRDAAPARPPREAPQDEPPRVELPLGEVRSPPEPGAGELLSSALVVESMGWGAAFEVASDEPLAPLLGALLLANARLRALPHGAREALTRAAEAVQEGLREADAAALARLLASGGPSPAAAERRRRWAAAVERGGERLRREALTPALARRLDRLSR